MHRPIAAPFQVSLPMVVGPADRLARLIDVSFGAIAILAACAVWVGAYRLGTAPGSASVLGWSCTALLVPSLLGLWVMRQAQDAPRLALARLYDSALRRLARGEALAVPDAAEGEGYVALAGLLGDLAILTRKLRRLWSQDNLAGGRLQESIRAARSQALAVARQMKGEAATLDEAALQAERTDAALTRCVDETAKSCDETEGAVGRALQRVTELTDTVRATTAGTRRMEEVASRLSLAAHGTQTAFAGLEDKLGRLDTAIAHIDHAVKTAGTQAEIGVTSSEADRDEADPDGIGQGMPSLSDATRTALDQCLTILRAVLSDTAAATRHVGDIDAAVQSQREAAMVLGRAVDRQGEEIGRILLDIYEARSGFATLRAGVDAVSRSLPSRAQAALALRDAAGKMPSHAEVVAGLLRDIPDFRPTFEE